MRISTKGRNAIKFMLDLAIYNNGEPVRIKDIASRQEISEKYLEQIVSTLNKAGLVKSLRGSKGGYLLSERPEDYTVGRILKTIEGSMSPVEVMGADVSPSDKVSRRIWNQLEDAINGVLEGITLADLLEWYYDMNIIDYCI